MEEVYKKLIKGIKEYFKKHGFKKAVIGLSGGIDSALSAKLVADAIGPENLHALIMPVKEVSSQENIDDAVEYCKILGVEYSLIYIDGFLSEFEKLGWKQNVLAEINTVSRMRAIILYNYANTHDALVIGTSNKTEILLGYFTKYGDGAVDIEVIGDLFKTVGIELAKMLKLPQNIIEKVPTAELFDGQTDEKELGAPYSVLDELLKVFEANGNLDSLKEKHGKLIDDILERIKKGEHKRKSVEVIKV